MFKWFWKKKKWTIPTLILILLITSFTVYKIKGSPAQTLVTSKVVKQDLKYTVLATGQVTSSVDLSLSFKGSGIVKQINTAVGQKVVKDQVLAQLDARDVGASITSAKASLAQAQANYQKLLDGASSEEVIASQRSVDAAQVALDNANNSLDATRKQQAVSVSNSYAALLNSAPQANASPSNLSTSTVTVTGSYNSTEQGQYVIRVYQSGGGMRFTATGLENAEGEVRTTPVPLGKRGLFIQFSTTLLTSTSDTWTINIPNTQATTYTANLNAYQAALETQASSITSATATVRNAESSLAQAQANLAVKKQQARPADLAASQAQILSAQGQLEAAYANYENTQIKAPANGTVTKVDIKVGENVTPGKEVIVIQDIDNLYVEANVSEANIASIKAGLVVEYTFDALGPDKKYAGSVSTIDPASTVVSGVVNYKVTAQVPKVAEVKPGMTANMTILIDQRSGVLTVPSRAVLIDGDNKKVRVVTIAKKATYVDRQVKTGLEGDGGLVEILSGLSEGEEVVTLIKQK